MLQFCLAALLALTGSGFCAERLDVKNVRRSLSGVSVPMPSAGFAVSLSATPNLIAPRTAFTEMVPLHQFSLITVSGDGALASSVILEAELLPDYVPQDMGSLFPVQGQPGVWKYVPFEELKTTRYPREAKIKITPKRSGVQCGEAVVIRVHPVFDFITTAHSHPPGAKLHVPDRQDYEAAWRYARWKYDIDTGNLTAIKYESSVEQMGLTNCGIGGVGRYCRLGTCAFLDENICASVLGHENVHGGQSVFMFFTPARISEKPAYQWEADHVSQTGIRGFYLEECYRWLSYFNGAGSPPKNLEILGRKFTQRGVK